ncbi:hypothetical protein [Streptomyces triticagri]|uniref:hypothetical protein n=1 Tax=Streptomyces triticagri TaxID=2293568 RepID=UPI001313DD85|nr:hypothetical protein [Streptomyces triticagri]
MIPRLRPLLVLIALGVAIGSCHGTDDNDQRPAPPGACTTAFCTTPSPANSPAEEPTWP